METLMTQLITQLKETRKELTSTEINHEAQVVGACLRVSLLHCLQAELMLALSLSMTARPARGLVLNANRPRRPRAWLLC